MPAVCKSGGRRPGVSYHMIHGTHDVTSSTHEDLYLQLQRRNKTSSNCLTSRTYPSLSRTAGSAASVANQKWLLLATLAWFCHWMSFSNPLKLCLLTQIWLVHLMLFSTSSLVASTKGKISLLCSLANHIHMMTCDTRAADHTVRSHRLPPLFLHPKTGGGEDLN